jgi:mRNA-degrading endonuclease RelE of RelBE toxin-antitoxin system
MILMQTLIKKIQSLPPDAQRQVEEYVDFLLSRHAPHTARKLSQDSAHGLARYGDQYIALELQKKALEWWNPFRQTKYEDIDQ